VGTAGPADAGATSGAAGSGRVVVVGSINADHVARVQHLPPPGATVSATSYRTAAGGKGLNQVVTAARQGAPTVMISAVGEDSAGSELLGVLDAEGVDRSGVRVVPGVPTGVALITVAADGSNVIVVAAGANGTVDPSQLDGFGWAPGDVALCQLEIPLVTVEAALRGARAAGARTLLNPAPATGPLPASLLGLVDVLVPNEGEAAILAGGEVPSGAGLERVRVLAAETGGVLAAETGGVVIVTVGERGSILVTAAGEITEIPAHRVVAVDTTAAGDSYCGALAAALAGGSDLGAAIRRASAAGSLATTREGAVPSLPTSAEVDALLAG
jgi:ribokinase